LAWRLHPAITTPAFRERALSDRLSVTDRRAALTALGYISTSAAAHAIADVAAVSDGWVKADAIWWLLNRKGGPWKDFGLDERLKRDGIYDPDNIEITEAVIPQAERSTLPAIADILKLKGHANRGGELIQSCTSCHRIGETGIDYGPDLTAFAKMQPPEVVIQSIIDPSADIAQGFHGTEVITHDDLTIHGILMSAGDPVIIRSASGLTQTIPAKRVKTRQGLNRSLMLSADQMGLKAQDLADILAYLRSL
jgi:putative heme-binding domain-containing protein